MQLTAKTLLHQILAGFLDLVVLATFKPAHVELDALIILKQVRAQENLKMLILMEPELLALTFVIFEQVNDHQFLICSTLLLKKFTLSFTYKFQLFHESFIRVLNLKIYQSNVQFILGKLS